MCPRYVLLFTLMQLPKLLQGLSAHVRFPSGGRTVGGGTEEDSSTADVETGLGRTDTEGTVDGTRGLELAREDTLVMDCDVCVYDAEDIFRDVLMVEATVDDWCLSTVVNGICVSDDTRGFVVDNVVAADVLSGGVGDSVATTTDDAAAVVVVVVLTGLVTDMDVSLDTTLLND